MGIRGSSHIKLVRTSTSGSELAATQTDVDPKISPKHRSLENFLEARLSPDIIRNFVEAIKKDRRFMNRFVEENLTGEEDMNQQRLLDALFKTNSTALEKSNEEMHSRTFISRKLSIFGEPFELSFSVYGIPSEYSPLHNNLPSVTLFWEDHRANRPGGNYPMTTCVGIYSGRKNFKSSVERLNDPENCSIHFNTEPDTRKVATALTEWLSQHAMDAFA